MLSRTADHLYWMARFTERAENLARLLAEPAETDLPEGGEPGIIDVRSGSPLISLDGTPYADW